MSLNYQKLVDDQARVMNVPSVRVEEQSFGSAATDRTTIFINPKFADKVKTTAGLDGLRFVLAHELGHARGGAGGGHEGEYLADRWAAQSVARVGASFEAVSGVMRNLNRSATRTHPASSDRETAAQVAWSEEAAVRAPQLGVRRALAGEEVPRPLVRNAKPKRDRRFAR